LLTNFSAYMKVNQNANQKLQNCILSKVLVSNFVFKSKDCV